MTDPRDPRLYREEGETAEPNEAPGRGGRGRRNEPARERAEPGGTLGAVITEEGLVDGSEPPPYLVPPPSPRRTPSVALVGLAAFAVGLWMLAAACQSATSQEVAAPANARLLDSLAETDALIALHADDIQQQLDEGASEVEVPGFPAAGISVPAEAARGEDGNLDAGSLRRALLARAGEAIYLRGPDAVLAPEREVADPFPLSDAGSVRELMRTLSASRHDIATIATWGTAAVAALLLLGLVVTARGFGRAGWPGVSLAIGGGLAALGALLVPVLLELLGAGPPGAVGDTYDTVVGDLAEGGLRNALTAFGAGVALIVPAIVLGAVFGGSRRVDGSEGPG